MHFDKQRAADCAISGNPSSTMPTELQDQMAQLNRVIDTLDGVVSRLSVRLQSVTNDFLEPKQTGANANAVPRATLSPLGDAIRDRVEHTDGIIARLESLIQRLAV